MPNEATCTKSSKKGMGHILQDLLSSTVRLNRSNFIPPPHYNFPLKIEPDNSSPAELRSSCCSICSEPTNLRPLALQEMEILAKFVLNQEQISLILQTEDHPPIFCCKICSPAILSLAKLTTQIENITLSLRAVICSRNGLFNKLRNESKITELTHEVEANNACPPDKLPTSDDDRRLSECLEVEEEFSVKVEHIDDDEDDNSDEITTDHLYMSESDNGSDNVENSVVQVQSKFVCKVCQPNVSFTKNENLIRHLKNKNIHPNISDAEIVASSLERRAKPFPCPKCDKTFASYGGLYQHKRLLHEFAPSRRKCNLCRGKVFNDSVLLRRHIQRCHSVRDPSDQAVRTSCDICLTTFASATNRNRHIEVVHFPDKTSCPYGCATQFCSEAEWVTHLEGCESTKMTAESECACQYCPAVFRNILLQIEHRLRVHPENTLSCSTCNQRFTRQCVLDEHRCTINERNVTHSESNAGAEPKLVCELCQPNVTFSTSRGFLAHMKNNNIHPDISDKLRSKYILALEMAPKKFACTKCGIKFKDKKNLTSHMRNKNIHPDNNGTTTSASPKKAKRRGDPLNPKSIPCLKCERSFTSYASLHRHMYRLHGGIKRKCTLCPRIFMRAGMLEAHMQEWHNDPMSTKQRVRYSCDMCSKSFTTGGSMYRHVELVHFSDKTSCPYGCPNKFGSEAEWVTHLEGCDSPKMSAESECVCEFCPAVFRNTLLRIDHTLREHREKCYACTFCGGIFSRANVPHNHSCKPATFTG